LIRKLTPDSMIHGNGLLRGGQDCAAAARPFPKPAGVPVALTRDLGNRSITLRAYQLVTLDAEGGRMTLPSGSAPSMMNS
jgi:hypothetical protein